MSHALLCHIRGELASLLQYFMANLHFFASSCMGLSATLGLRCYQLSHPKKGEVEPEQRKEKLLPAGDFNTTKRLQLVTPIVPMNPVCRCAGSVWTTFRHTCAVSRSVKSISPFRPGEQSTVFTVRRLYSDGPIVYPTTTIWWSPDV